LAGLDVDGPCKIVYSMQVSAQHFIDTWTNFYR